MTLYFLLTAVAAFLAGAALGLVLRRRPARRDQQAARSLQARFDSLFAAGNAAMALCDESHRITSANPRLVELTSRLPDELLGAPLADLLAPEDRLAPANMLAEISAGRRDAVLASTRLQTADRGGVPVNLWAARIQDQGLVCVFVENGLSAWAEQRLRESRDLLTSLLEAIPIPIFLVDDSGDFLWANHAFSEFLGCGGCGPEEAEHDDCRRQAHTIFSPDDPFLAAAPGADTGTESREIRLTDSQGRTREMDLSLAWVDQGGGSRAVAGALLDLSEPRAASRRLEEALAELQAILDNSLMGVALIRDGQVVKTNRRGARMFGYDPDEIQGAHASVFLFSKDQYRRFSDAAEDAIRATGRYEGEQLMRRKDGTAIWCRLHARSMREDAPGHGVLWTVDDFTERKLMEDELMAAKETAEAASHAKTQFLANMSHEIRTPLNAVTGLTDILLSADLCAEHREMISTIQDSTKQLLAVLSDILDYARLDGEQVQLDESPFLLAELMEQLERDIRPRAQQKDLDFFLETPKEPLSFVGDRRRLRQILVGLLGNAVKFTDQGAVTLRAEAPDIMDEPEETAVLEFAVEDTGVGIPADELEPIFDVFHQGDESSTRRYGGTGIGLAICRRLVHLLGGAISVRSDVGRGTTFFVSIPLARPDPEQLAQLEERRVAEIALQVQDPQRPLSILLAEDNHVNQKVLARLLGRRGHSVTVAVNGRDAVDALERTAFDLVLMDIQMPEMDGVTATRAIRDHSDRRVAATPIVALTAHAMRGDRERFLEAGMNEYVPKPVNPSDLEAAMATALGAAPPCKPPPPAGMDEAPGQALLDTNMALERLDHDESFLRDMYHLYLEDAPARIQELRAAHQEGRLREAGELAHSLKGISLSVGAVRLSDLAYELEKAGRGGDLQGFEDRIDELGRVYEATAEAIRGRMAQEETP